MCRISWAGLWSHAVDGAQPGWAVRGSLGAQDPPCRAPGCRGCCTGAGHPVSSSAPLPVPRTCARSPLAPLGAGSALRGPVPAGCRWSRSMLQSSPRARAMAIPCVLHLWAARLNEEHPQPAALWPWWLQRPRGPCSGPRDPAWDQGTLLGPRAGSGADWGLRMSWPWGVFVPPKLG